MVEYQLIGVEGIKEFDVPFATRAMMCQRESSADAQTVGESLVRNGICIRSHSLLTGYEPEKEKQQLYSGETGSPLSQVIKISATGNGTNGQHERLI